MRHRLRNYVIRHWRVIVNVITLTAMALLVYALRHQIVDTLQNVQNVQYWALLLMIPLQLVNYDVYARMYGDLLAHLKQPVAYRSLYRVALELNFVNHAFPSGGISGISYFGLRLRRYGVKPGSATLIQLLKFIFVFISFQILIALGLLALAIGDKANNIMLLFAAVLATLTLVGTGLLAYIVGDRERIKTSFTWLTKGLNRLIHLIRPHHPETIKIAKLQDFANDLHDSFSELRGNMALLKKCVWYALVANATEISTIYVVYIAFGEWVNIGAVIIAYAIANFAGLISVLPGGIGIYEALMTAALAAGGIPAALTIPVIVMYRVLSMIIQLLPGWFFYHKSLREGQTKAD